MAPADISHLKRKFQDMEKVMQFAGPGIRAIVIKRLPQPQPKYTPEEVAKKIVKKSPPTPLRVLVITDTFIVDVFEKSTTDGSYGAGDSVTVTKGQTLWFKDFDIPNEAVVGSIVLISMPKGNMYNDHFNLKGKIKVLDKATYGKLNNEFDDFFFKMPMVDDIKQYDDLFLAVNTEKQYIFQTYTWGRHENDVYVNKKKVPAELSAYIAGNKGYPFIVKDTASDKEYCVILKFYENVLLNFGIVDPNMFSVFGGMFFEKFRGYINSSVDFLNTQDDNGSYEYVVTAFVGSMYIDLPYIIKNVGFEVSDTYVKDHFKGELLVESNFAHKNLLYMDRANSPVICLDEYTGKLTSFLDNSEWKFYAVVDVDLDTAFSNDVEAVRHQGSVEDIEASLKSFQDPVQKTSASVTLEYEFQYIFAIKQ
jgi:hypothetical protein